MKKLTVFLVVLCLMTTLFSSFAFARVSVRGYYRSNGTYVAPHYRTSPDYSFYNNWSSWGNINPYTGVKGYKTK